MTAPAFLVHGKEDTVGEVVVENPARGWPLIGLSMEGGGHFAIAVREDTPRGDGVALLDITLRTANGRLTAAEALGHLEFVLTKLYTSA